MSTAGISVPVERRARNVALIDLLDRLLQGGVVISGDLTLAAADIDLVKVDLRILVAAIDKAIGP
jgi:hypothetical protein